MTCFIDNPNCDEEYKQRIFDFMPLVKKSRYCKGCLTLIRHEVEPINCPYFNKTVKERKGLYRERMKHIWYLLRKGHDKFTKIQINRAFQLLRKTRRSDSSEAYLAFLFYGQRYRANKLFWRKIHGIVE